MTEGVQQVYVSVKEAARIAGISTRQLRIWLKEGRIRGEMVQGKFGPTWQIDATQIPTRRTTGSTRVHQASAGELPPAAVGVTTGVMVETRLLEMLQQAQEKIEGASVRIGQLEALQETIPALTANAESQQQRAETAERELHQAESEIHLLKYKNLLLLIGLIVVLVAMAAMAWLQYWKV